MSSVFTSSPAACRRPFWPVEVDYHPCTFGEADCRFGFLVSEGCPYHLVWAVETPYVEVVSHPCTFFLEEIVVTASSVHAFEQATASLVGVWVETSNHHCTAVSWADHYSDVSGLCTSNHRYRPNPNH